MDSHEEDGELTEESDMYTTTASFTHITPQSHWANMYVTWSTLCATAGESGDRQTAEFLDEMAENAAWAYGEVTDQPRWTVLGENL